MSENEIKKETVEAAQTAAESGSAIADGIGRELVSQLNDFSKKAVASDSVKTFIEFDGMKEFSLSAEEKGKFIKNMGEGLQEMVKGELPHLRDMMKRNGLDTSAVDAKIKAAEKEAAAMKPLHDAVLKGDIQSLQKLVATMKPEELEKFTDTLQKHFDSRGLGIELDYANGQLIVSRNNGDRAVAIGKDKTDVIGVNADGSYDFNRQYRRENPGKELQGMTDDAARNYLYPPRNYLPYDHIPTTKAYPEGGFLPKQYENFSNKLGQ